MLEFQDSNNTLLSLDTSLVLSWYFGEDVVRYDLGLFGELSVARGEGVK